uniref:Uncharacterized protein n=1 Tax=Rangifer tarandus platyrhynchus TaxID=3082113 RepID=A0ACB0EVD7_RANTA|nr:unnamed protein product [Rangifer tarandus platyrhynchus]
MATAGGVGTGPLPGPSEDRWALGVRDPRSSPSRSGCSERTRTTTPPTPPPPPKEPPPPHTPLSQGPKAFVWPQQEGKREREEPTLGPMPPGIPVGTLCGFAHWTFPKPTTTSHQHPTFLLSGAVPSTWKFTEEGRKRCKLRKCGATGPGASVASCRRSPALPRGSGARRLPP